MAGPAWRDAETGRNHPAPRLARRRLHLTGCGEGLMASARPYRRRGAARMTDPDVSRRRERWRRQAQYLRDNGRLTSVPFRAAHHESAHAVASIYGLRETP